jgi:hypothetical protein
VDAAGRDAVVGPVEAGGGAGLAGVISAGAGLAGRYTFRGSIHP